MFSKKDVSDITPARNISLDILKLLLASMVVALHASFLSDINPLASYLTTSGLFRIAVPLFLLINGFYFFPVLTKGKAATWFRRIGLLYAFWMSVYAYFWLRALEPSLASLATVLSRLVLGYAHLWYLAGLLGAALILMLIETLRPSVRLITASLILTFLIGVAIQYLGNYHVFAGSVLDILFNKTRAHRNFLFLAYPFFALGYLTNKLSLHKKISSNVALVACICGFALLMAESYFNYIAAAREGAFDNFAALIIVCPALFIVVSNLNFRGQTKVLASYANGIYFIHYLFLFAFLEVMTIGGTLLTLLMLIASVAASYLLILINKRVGFIL